MATTEELKRRLEAERDRLRTRIADHEEYAVAGNQRLFEERNGPDNQPADQGTGTLDQEMAVGVEMHLRGMLKEVEDALDRIEKGTYGICENCNEKIDPARLEALPWAKTCLRCTRPVSK